MFFSHTGRGTLLWLSLMSSSGLNRIDVSYSWIPLILDSVDNE